jgi:hypothetical protein
LDAHNPDMVNQIYDIKALEASTTPLDYELLKPFFSWDPADTITHTLSVTTQYARGRVSANLREHWKSCFPACNVNGCNEVVATDTVFSDTVAVFTGGSKVAQIFIGRNSLAVARLLKYSLGVSHLLLMYMLLKQAKSLSTSLKTICKRGEMDKLISDYTRAETSTCIKDIICALFISN